MMTDFYQMELSEQHWRSMLISTFSANIRVTLIKSYKKKDQYQALLFPLTAIYNRPTVYVSQE